MMNHKMNHPFHLVNFSPWPITSALSTFMLMSGLLMWFNQYSIYLFFLGIIITILNMFQWWRDICREGTFQGLHSINVINGLKWGMILFIISEIFFFFSFFWMFFHSSLSPNIEMGMLWPPLSIYPFNPFQIPLLNTLILLSSGISTTWAHHSILENNHFQGILSLMMTIILGIYFSILQAYEYMKASFSIADSVYGASFFLMTGFHGIHVLIGTSFLIICLTRYYKFHFSYNHHFGFEAAAWYWHFVDVVWLFLYISIYWWGF